MRKIRAFLSFFLMLISAFSVHAEVTHLHIESISGSESMRVLALIGKMVIGSDSICLYDTDGVNLGCTPLRQVGRIVFLNEEPLDVETPQSPAIRVFPNPTHDCLLIQGLEGTQTVRMYSLQGQPVLSAEAAEGEASLFVGTLPQGTYLLQVGAQVVKIIKE